MHTKLPYTSRPILSAHNQLTWLFFSMHITLTDSITILGKYLLICITICYWLLLTNEVCFSPRINLDRRTVKMGIVALTVYKIKSEIKHKLLMLWNYYSKYPLFLRILSMSSTSWARTYMTVHVSCIFPLPTEFIPRYVMGLAVHIIITKSSHPLLTDTNHRDCLLKFAMTWNQGGGRQSLTVWLRNRKMFAIFWWVSYFCHNLLYCNDIAPCHTHNNGGRCGDP